jgi:putative transcriptional regulator
MNLTNKFLASLPTITGGTFYKSVIYVEKHTGDGATGWIINKQLADDTVSQRLRKGMRLVVDIPIYYGGPVDANTAVVLHSSDLKLPVTKELNTNLSMTRDKSIVNIMNIGQFPELWRVIIGRASWGAGQLESEILGSRTNGVSSWVTVDYSDSLMWNTLPSKQWERAIEMSAMQLTDSVLNLQETK